MVTIIKSKTTQKRFLLELQKLSKRKKFNASKHCGVLSIKGDPLELQKKMRDEWD